MMKRNIYGLTLAELQDAIEQIGEKKFRALQIYEWLYIKKVQSFDEMSNLSKALKDKLNEHFVIGLLKIREKQVAKDGTTKYLFELSDGGLIETVLMRFNYGDSVCVTSQLGCNMGCAFCASGLLKKQRDLTAGEMVAQIMMVNFDQLINEGKHVTHVVVMGTGEPFDNYENVDQFIHVLNEPKGLAIGARHMTISTCGIVPKINEYALNGLQTNLAISLHAPNDEIRDQIMPINKAYPLEVLRESVKEYIKKTNRRVTFEYILLKDVNDSVTHARQLAHYVKGLNCYINLIPYNSVDEHGYQQSPKENVEKFHQELLRLKINATQRKEHGGDIDAACGQLRAKKMLNK